MAKRHLVEGHGKEVNARIAEKRIENILSKEDQWRH